MTDAAKPTVTIKKYANRRLYNTATSSYVTLEDLAKMVKEGVEFNVYDAKTSEDLTRSVLTQIIVEEEGKTGQNLLPIGFLRQLIGFYGDNMQWMVPKYLEHSMQTLARNQEQLRGYFQTTFGPMFPFGTTIEEMGKQNVAMFERAMRMFTPLGGVMMAGVTPTDTPSATKDRDSAPNQAEAHDPAPVIDTATSALDEREQAAEDAFTPSIVTNIKPVMPTPAVAQASAASAVSGGDDVQNKIAALQRQLADLAKNKI